MIAGVIIDLVIGIGCMVMGLLVWKKQMILLVNDYQRKNVRKDDIPAYTRMIGIGLLIIGAGICLTGIINLIFQSWLGWIAFGLGFITGIVVMYRAQKKYNNRFFIKNFVLQNGNEARK